jgi:hypothetical protein
MPEMEVEPWSMDRPLISLPRGGPQTVGVFVEIAKAVAGCYICRRPIPKGVTRISFRCVMPMVMQDDGTEVPPRRRTQKYSVHVGCLVKPMGSEVKRSGQDCWDCGGQILNVWAYAFTTHRFAWGSLCPQCQQKPRWLLCGNCQVFYPRHMIQSGHLSEIPTRKPDPDDPFTDPGPTQSSGDWCLFCAERYGVLTDSTRRESAEIWEEARQQIMEGRLFNDE